MKHRLYMCSWHSWALFLNYFRRAAKRSKLSVTLHKFRQLVHFAPWRVAPIYIIQKFRPPVSSIDRNRNSILGIIDEKLIVNEIHKNSVAILNPLPSYLVSNLRKITDGLPPEEYQLVHQVNEDVLGLTQDPGIKKLLRAYFKAEPVLLESSLFVSQAEQCLPEHQQNLFHFDYAGWQSLNVYVYLTDVNENSSYHVVAKGSHRDIRITDVLRGSLNVAEGERRFSQTIQNITGPAGTIFIENTEAFHRRHRGNERRVMLNLLFTSHKSLLSHGRASSREISMRNRSFKKLQPV